MKPRIAFVIQRYGEHIHGGAEQYCRMIAENMVRHWDIDVLTTTAKDSLSWINYYPQGLEILNGVTIKRFSVDRKRNMKSFNKLTSRLRSLGGSQSVKEGEEWLRAQGPFSSELTSFIEENKNYYDYFFFYTALYPTAYFGIQPVAAKSILVPLAHDEFVMNFPVYMKLFRRPLYMIFSTPEERDFIYSNYKNSHIRGSVIGSGIASEMDTSATKRDGSHKFSELLQHDYIIYAGRIDPGKGVYELIDYFKKLKGNLSIPIKLVIVGSGHPIRTGHQDIIYTGFIEENIKMQLIQHAKVLVNPSYFESFSLVLLEAWAARVPVLVNGKCSVLRGQVERSRGGLIYTNYDEFSRNLLTLLNNKTTSNKFASRGKKYYLENYSWNIIREKYLTSLKYLNRNAFLLGHEA